MSVPNRNGLSVRALGPRYHMVGLEHLNYFTPSSLKLLLERTGFIVLKTQTRSFNPLTFWKDHQGRHLSGQFRRSDLIADQQQNVQLRKKPATRVMERLVDFAVTLLGVGDLLIVTAQRV